MNVVQRSRQIRVNDSILVLIQEEGVNTMATVNVKEAVHELADQLSNDATWDDVIYEMTVRSEIDKGMADSND